MKNITLAAAMLAAGTGAASAGGFDRSGQPLGWLFEKGNYVELSYGTVKPKVKGTQTTTLSGTSLAGSGSGNMAGSYKQVSLAMKMDLGEQLSLGLQLDPTYGADVSYPVSATGYFLRGTKATIDGDTLTLAARYKISDAFSVHAGIRHVSIGGNVTIVRDAVPSYQASFGRDSATGFLVGVAYEKPEIALRVALTYSSATKHQMPTTVAGAPAGSVPVELPQSVALDFQSGIAANTLLFGQIRWSDWTSTVLNGPFLGAANPLISYDNDVITYSLGVGRKFSDSWSGAVTLGYEDSKGGIAGNFAPTDGNFSVGLGATYTKGNMKITGGVRYIKVGNTAALELPSPPFPAGSPGAQFSKNHATAFGLKVAFTF